MKKSYLLLILLLTASSFANAQWTNYASLNTEVKDSVDYEESVPISATTSDGYTYVSYFALYNGSYQMRMQLLDSAGNKLFGTLGLLISNQPQSSALFRYDMKVDENDNAIVAFQDTRSNGDLHIVVYKIDRLGVFLWGANGIQLIDPVSNQGLGPTIGFTNAGNIIIGWNATSSTNYKWVSFKKFSAAGAPLWSNNLRVIDSTFTHKYSRQTFAPAGADDFLLLYAEETGAGLPPSKMFAQRYDNGGNKVWVNTVQLSTNTIPFFFFCKAESDNNDGFYVGFNTSNAAIPSQGDVYVQHIDGSGNLWNPTGNVACALINTQKFTAATHFDAANNSVWVLIKTTDVNQGMSGVAIQQFSATGNAVLGTNAVQLVSIASAYHDPNDFCITPDGVISFYISGNYPNQTLHAIKNDFAGILLWGGNQVNICSVSAGKDDLTTGMFANNQAVAVWDDNRNDYGVYAQNIDNNGQLGAITSVEALTYTQNLFSVLPNPFNEELTVNSNQFGEKATIKIYDVFGRIIFEEQRNDANCTLPTAAWQKGIYFIQLVNEIKKIVKQ